ncbi:MAG: tetratricopeptide repeat protein [Polyangiales bacterium]
MPTTEDVTAQLKKLIAEHRYQDAVRLSRRALLSKPESVPIRMLLGVALLALRRFDEVRTEMTTVLRHAPREAAAYRLLGEAYVHAGQPERAKEPLKQAISLAPGDRMAQALLDDANSQELSSEDQDTINQWFNPEGLVTQQRHVNELGVSGKPPAAAATAAPVESEPPDAGDVTMQRAEAYVRSSEGVVPRASLEPPAPPPDRVLVTTGEASRANSNRPVSKPPPLPKSVRPAMRGPSERPFPSKGGTSRRPPPPSPSTPSKPVGSKTVLGIGAPPLPTGLSPGSAPPLRESSAGRVGAPPPAGLLGRRASQSGAPVPSSSVPHTGAAARPILPPSGLTPFDETDESVPTRLAVRNSLHPIESDFPVVSVEQGTWSDMPASERPPSNAPGSRRPSTGDSDPAQSINPLWNLGKSANDRPPRVDSRPPPAPRARRAPWAPSRGLLVAAGVLLAAIVVLGVAMLFLRGNGAEEANAISLRAERDGRRVPFADARKLLVGPDTDRSVTFAHADVIAAAYYEHGLGSDAEVARLLDEARAAGVADTLPVAIAHLALSRGEPARALEATSKKGDPETAELFYVRAHAEEESGSPELALEAARNATRLAPGSPRYTSYRAWLEADLGDRDGALKLLQGIEGGDAFPAVRIARARVLASAGDAAGEMLAEVSAVESKLMGEASPTERTWLSVLAAKDALARGDRASAARHIQVALSLGPRPELVLWKTIAEVALATGDVAQARAVLEAMPRHVRASSAGALVRAKVALAAGDLGTAEEALHDASESAQRMLIEGELAQRLGKLGDAERAYRGALGDPRTRAEATMALAKVLFERGAADGVIKLIESLEEDERTESMLGMLVRAHVVLGHSKQASAVLDEALRRSPDSVTLRMARAELKLRFDTPSAALADARSLLSLRPDDPDVSRIVGEANLRAGRWPDAETAFAKVKQALPDDPVARAGLARVALHALDVPRAATLLEGLEANPDPRVRRAVGELLVFEGAGAKAAAVLEPLVKDSDDLALRNWYGEALLQAESYASAQKVFTAVLDADPKNADANLGMARAIMRTPRVNMAERYIDQAERDAADQKLGSFFEARAHAARARLAFELGALVLAQSEAKKALEIVPKLGPAAHVLADVAIDMGGRPTAPLEEAEKAILTPPEALGQLAVRLRGARACEVAKRYIEAAPSGFDAPRVRLVLRRCR